MLRSLPLFLLGCSLPLLATNAFEERALQLSRDIIDRHLPYGTILNPLYASASSNELVTYTRCGDSAIWTGHWLAAEAFRYKVTGSPEALDAVQKGVAGLKLLIDVTGVSVLARCALRADSPYSAGPVQEEKDNGVYAGSVGGIAYQWVGHTSRDQYLGAFFGLSIAYDLVPDAALRAAIRDVITRALERLIAKGWAIVMPDGDISTVFWLRPDQQLALLQVGRQVNPTRFSPSYEDVRRSAAGLKTIMALESLDPYGSYYKFNLDAIMFYLLIHYEEASSPVRSAYLDAYSTFRNTVRSHQNAFFNVIDRTIRGSEAVRDAETVRLLTEWLQRPERDLWVDLRAKYKACGDNRACNPIPVPERVTTDFLWQRSPFQLSGGGTGQIESPGIDFLLPWWMSRSYGSISPDAPSVASAASADRGIAPESIASLFGAGFLAGSRVLVRDSAGVECEGELFYRGDRQINFVVPPGTLTGPGLIRVLRADGVETHSTAVTVDAAAPAIFSANASGQGAAAAVAVQSIRGGVAAIPVFQCSGPLICVARPLQPASGRPVYLSLFATGIRGARVVHATFAGQELAVEYSGPQGQFDGLDQVNVRIESGLRTRGEHDLVVTGDGATSNPVRILIE